MSLVGLLNIKQKKSFQRPNVYLNIHTWHFHKKELDQDYEVVCFFAAS